MVRYGWMMVAVCALGIVAPPTAWADYYDCFNDGWYERDPNDPRYDANYPYWTDPNNCVLWDSDNPDWEAGTVIGETSYMSAQNGWMRTFAATVWFPFCAFAASVDDGDPDPNTSVTLGSDMAPHYIVAKMEPYHTDKGEIGLFMHADPVAWMGYCMTLELDTDHPLALASVNADSWRGRGSQSRMDLDVENGFWMALQWVGDGDPNNSYLKGAAWNGDKFDWDGVWDIDVHVLTAWDPNETGGTGHVYWGEGVTAIAVIGAPENGSPNAADGRFDNIESGWGTFTNVSHALSLTVTNDHMGSVAIDPDLLDDCNNIDPNYWDPTDWTALRRYTNGTQVVLTAQPLSGKSLKHWLIWDPNHPGDANYVSQDTNTVLYLTLDADWVVEAAFKCGGSSALPPIAMVLLGLTLTLIIRRIR